jgi:hypothetical protein
MSKIEEAKEVIRQLQVALGLQVSMVASGESPSETSTLTKLDAQKRAQQWLDSLKLPEPVCNWPPHQQRVWVEREELQERATKCSVFIGENPFFETLSPIDQELLKEQNDIMWQLWEILGKRIERFFPQEPEAVTVRVRMAPGAEPLNAEKLKELDEYLNQQIKRRGAPKLFNVQDSERPAFVIAHSFEEALQKWKVAVAEENATDSEYEEVPPAGIMHVCDGDELIIDHGFADKANL